MGEHLGIIEILGIAGSVSLLSGWRLYLCVLATGLAMQFGALPLPAHLQSLQVLANPYAATGYVVYDAWARMDGTVQDATAFVSF